MAYMELMGTKINLIPWVEKNRHSEKYYKLSFKNGIAYSGIATSDKAALCIKDFGEKYISLGIFENEGRIDYPNFFVRLITWEDGNQFAPKIYFED